MANRPAPDDSATARAAAFMAEYAQLARARPDVAHQTLASRLAGAPSADWLDCAQALVLRRDLDGAIAVLSSAIKAHPDTPALQHALAGLLWQAQRSEAAEPLLRTLIAGDSADVAATFLLARVLREQGRMGAMETALRALFDIARPSIERLIEAIELLDDCNRKHAAADLCERAIAAGSTDPRLHAYAGMLALHLGQFERVRERYLFAIEHDERALDWQAATALASAQRYADAAHADFELFRNALQRPGRSAPARASLLFALGKACDDIADLAQATDFFRQANAIVDGISPWSRKNWRRVVESRLNAKPSAHVRTTQDDCVPVFIVGVPRSGTTLITEWLARHPDVCHRGELGWMAHLASELAQSGTPDSAALDRAAATYLAHLRQDDSNAHWFIDKQPLNFLHVDLIATLFPQARIIHCQRDTRDTALSIWMQYFVGAENNFAYDFGNIAAVIGGCDRLMAKAHAAHRVPIHPLRYEEAVRDPDGCMRNLAAWLQLPDFDDWSQTSGASSIATASAWQARQPVYTGSIGRWRAYAPYLPELRELFPEAVSA